LRGNSKLELRMPAMTVPNAVFTGESTVPKRGHYGAVFSSC
jgi:hypothetical protein